MTCPRPVLSAAMGLLVFLTAILLTVGPARGEVSSANRSTASQAVPAETVQAAPVTDRAPWLRLSAMNQTAGAGAEGPRSKNATAKKSGGLAALSVAVLVLIVAGTAVVGSRKSSR